MRRLWSALVAATTLTLAVSWGATVHAADAPDPSVHEIYEAAQAGHFDQAQTMMDQVLRDHPKSGKAHYVQAELYAKQGKTALARAELSQAEEFDPGLSHENQKAVQALKGELGVLPRGTQAPRVTGMNTAPSAPHIPWGTLLVVVIVGGVLWMIFRRRSPASYPMGAPAVGGGPGGYAGPGPGLGGYGGPGAPMGGGGGMGSGIAGGLASGLAVGAGVVAGEELAHHFMDGGHRDQIAPAADNTEWQQTPSNGDMGGSDFGVNDSGSWDDSGGGGGGGGGGDDWS